MLSKLTTQSLGTRSSAAVSRQLGTPVPYRVRVNAATTTAPIRSATGSLAEDEHGPVAAGCRGEPQFTAPHRPSQPQSSAGPRSAISARAFSSSVTGCSAYACTSWSAVSSARWRRGASRRSSRPVPQQVVVEGGADARPAGRGVAAGEINAIHAFALRRGESGDVDQSDHVGRSACAGDHGSAVGVAYQQGSDPPSIRPASRCLRCRQPAT